MGLFGDDFYSTKVSRRAEPEQKGKLQIIRPGGGRRTRDRWSNPRRARSEFSSTVKVAVISSVISSIVTVTLFSFISQPATQLPLANAAGQGGGGTAQTAQVADPYDRIINAAAEVRPSVVSIVNHKTGSSLSMEDSALGSGVIFKRRWQSLHYDQSPRRGRCQ